MPHLTLHELDATLTLPVKLARAGEFLGQAALTPAARSRTRLSRVAHPALVRDLAMVTDAEIDQVKENFLAACESFGHVAHIPGFKHFAETARAVRNALAVEYAYMPALIDHEQKRRLAAATGVTRVFADDCDDILYVFEMCKPSNADAANLVEDTLTIIGYRRFSRNLYRFLTHTQDILRTARRAERRVA